jgi:hypothetical protein
MAIFFVLFGLGFIGLSIYAIYDTIKERINDRRKILAMNDEQLITNFQMTINHLNSLPRILYRGNIQIHKRLMRKLSLIKKQLRKRGFKVK